DDRPFVMAAAAQMLDGDKLIEPREIKFVKKSGEVMTGLTFSSVIRFEGKPAIETMVVDVTFMKQMEQELGSTKERLQYLLDTAPIMMFQLDSEGRFLYANNETLRTTGYRPDEWEGKSFAPIVHPEDLPLAMLKFEEGRKGTKRRDYKLRIINANGELKVLYINARTIREHGRFAGSLIIARDVTEQLRLEETVKEARDHLANIIENAGDAIITLDIEGRVVSWNSSAESMFRLTRAEAAGQSLCSLPESDSGELAQLLDRVARGQTVRDREIEHTLKDGTRLNALFTFSPIRDATGNVVGISCFAKDITERRHLEKQLEVDKDFIDQLIENANAMIAVVNEEGKLIVFNRRFEEVTGFRKEEALGKDPMDVYVPEESREIVYRSVREIRQGNPVLELEVPIVSNEGKPLIVTWSGAAVKLPSGQDGIVVVGQDVTEQKRMHEELVQSKKLTSIGELVSGVAHELNNPLTVVMGYSQLLTTEQKLSKKHREMGQKILEAATRSKRIVENLLAFARKRKLEKHEVDVNEIMENTLSLREHNLTVNNVRIIRKYDEKLPPTYADGHQLQQVFLNLINNAFDAMHDAHQRGTLEVKTYKSNGRIMVEVIDDGPGIPASMQDKIFDPFFTTKEVGKGTGLGMSLSYGIIKEHGGRIYLDKTYHRGARFIIELPMTATPSPTGAK
ncbi:MAG: PAS domain S-box protein, partial [Candidatus Hydrogenedentota bacterium]